MSTEEPQVFEFNNKSNYYSASKDSGGNVYPPEPGPGGYGNTDSLSFDDLPEMVVDDDGYDGGVWGALLRDVGKSVPTPCDDGINVYYYHPGQINTPNSDAFEDLARKITPPGPTCRLHSLDGLVAPRSEEPSTPDKQAVVGGGSRHDTEGEDGDFVDAVTERDVLLGRGPLVYHHEGNLRFHREKERLQDAYLCAPISRKMTISQLLVDTVKVKGGSFLKFHRKAKKWYKVPNGIARKKASRALREALKKLGCDDDENDGAKQKTIATNMVQRKNIHDDDRGLALSFDAMGL